MKINQPGPHLDHLMRQTRLHHVQLSFMADVKANGLMTMAALMMTLSAPYLVQARFQAAVAVLMAFCLLTILLATLAVMPKVPLWSGRSDPAAARRPGFNVLFFGDFLALDQAQYEKEMEQVLNDHSRAYEVQVREIYVLGRFLATKKYRLLRCAYLAFVIGLLASGGVLVFASI